MDKKIYKEPIKSETETRIWQGEFINEIYIQ